jgi:hypothetical protein
MSNQTVLKRLHVLIDQSDAASAANGSFERLIQSHLEALEGIALQEIHRARDLAHQVCHCHFIEGEEDFGDPVDAKRARDEFHSFVYELEGRFGNM